MQALTEIGQIGVTDDEGNYFLFNPSFENIAKIGNPKEIVQYFHWLHNERMCLLAAMRVMRVCLEHDVYSDKLIGWIDGDKDSKTFDKRIDGSIPDGELIILARSLMTDGIAGRAKPTGKSGEGKYSDSFDASEFVDAAMVHLGTSAADAWRLTMTQFQRQIEMKFPAKNKVDMTEDQYKKAKAELMAKREKAGL
jgi:hypothetical protein